MCMRVAAAQSELNEARISVIYTNTTTNTHPNNVYHHVTFFNLYISTTNLAACVCVCAKCDQFLPARFYFESKRPEIFFRIAKFPYATFGPLFAFHCPLFFTTNNDLECTSSRFAVIVRSSVADKQLA